MRMILICARRAKGAATIVSRMAIVCQQLSSILCQIGNPRGARVAGSAGHVKSFIFFLLLTIPGARARELLLTCVLMCARNLGVVLWLAI